ncbi:MAG: PAS domain-containing protein [Oceanicoccus sp.]|uniref:ATP-binding protein n=1 Tax=Oceanicoccus sp. TaxID=2691044 RepID=UPI00261A9082|nr:ATP-binding protein [Oceanicoccus sp.]MCP3908181.1 PAS domain-containing protein [Oceanicoccus sp.]
MSFELSQLFLIGLGYLLLLFGIAHIADRGLIPEQLIRHPLTYVLSLGVFASAWAVYGVVGLAHEYGYGFLSYYLGVAGTFIFAPLLLLPILRIARTYLHSSLADVLTFRYRTQWAGSLITLCTVLAVWPLLALQIQAVTDSLHILTTISSNGEELFTQETRHNMLAFVFCLAICLFAISFGSRHLTAHERHNGLVAAIAFESVIKLIAMLVVGVAAVYQVFGGFEGMDRWLTANPQIVSLLNFPMREDSSRALLLIFFSAAVVMPHLFHMIFAENPNVKAMQIASWGVPLFLMLMSLPVLPILWAGFKLETVIPPEYFTLAIGVELESSALAILVYIGGLSAASGAMIVTTLALASMCLKHLILPVYRPSTDRDIYRWLLWIRRILIVLIILTGYGFYRFIAGREALSSLGLAAFIATLQFFPGVLAALYWQGANRNGFIAGLITGFVIWFVTLLLPIITTFDPAFIGKLYFNLVYDDLWTAATIVSLGMNMLVFVVVSLLTSTSEAEKNAAEVCATDDLNRPMRRLLSVQNPEQMKDQLATALGARTAQREVDRALHDMQMPDDESRPFALRRLRYRVEANLSGLLGPSVAHDMVNQLLPYATSSNGSSGEDINLIEVQLENYKTHLTGLAVDLDNLRRYHRQTLQNLPVGVCSLGEDGEILMWNNAIAEFTGISTFDVIGSNLRSLPKPWGDLLSDFLQMPQPHLYKQHYEGAGSSYWFNLHKTLVGAEEGATDGRVIVLENTTDVQMLEDELMHSERLASIGRLAAGVAHEIGNPVTGIACLAQNLRYDTDNPESLETGREILVQTDRVSKIVQTLVNFAHSGGENANNELGPVHIKSCVEEAIHLLHLNKAARQVRFENHCDDELYAIADSQRLLQVFVNLLSNARDASPEQSAVIVDTELRNQKVYINVTDRGSGISKEHQEQIFDPFFTTKEAGEGTGLGLSLVYSIVDDLNGSISVESPADPEHGGTRFTLRLYHHQQG